MTIGALNMSIANIKTKVVSIAQNPKSSNDNSIARKFEVISSNFKSTPTIIARDLNLEGQINSGGLIEVEGTIKGTIKGNAVILREGCIVEGVIIADSLSIRGNFEGNIKAKSLNISNKAKVVGEIEYGTLSVEDGACIDGRFSHTI